MNNSKLGWILSLAYVVLSAYLIYTQGLFGESFITLILGLPWTLGLSFFEYFGAGSPFIYILAIGPIVLNSLVLFWLGSRLGRR